MMNERTPIEAYQDKCEHLRKRYIYKYYWFIQYRVSICRECGKEIGWRVWPATKREYKTRVVKCANQ